MNNTLPAIIVDAMKEIGVTEYEAVTTYGNTFTITFDNKEIRIHRNSCNPRNIKFLLTACNDSFTDEEWVTMQKFFTK